MNGSARPARGFTHHPGLQWVNLRFTENHPPYDSRLTLHFGAPSRHAGAPPTSRLIRQTHRWTSLVFALLVGAIVLALGLGSEPAQWPYLLPLASPVLLLLTGLTLFVLPYLGRTRRVARPE